MCAKSRWNRLSGAFTLIEMLVVIAIIALLAGMLLPAFAAARERSRQASCKNQLHQMMLGVEVYRTNFNDYYVPVLSALYPVYIATEKVYVCPSDDQRGVAGSMPEWFSVAPINASQFAETDETKGRDIALGIDLDTSNPSPLSGAFYDYEREIRAAYRSTEVAACSYIYEFSAVPCSWWYWSANDFDANRNKPEFNYADFNHDGFVSWYEAKQKDVKGINGVDANGRPTVDEKEIYGGAVPMIRCFWHVRRGKSLDKEMVLNVACEYKNVYDSTAEGDGWKNAARRMR